MALTENPLIVKSGGTHIAILADTEVLAGHITLTAAHANELRLDTDGSNRNVTLPAENVGNGAWFNIYNWSSGANNLVILNAAGSTLLTINQNEMGRLRNVEGVWTSFGVTTIALT